MEVATTVSTRATCPRKQVGAVIVRDRMILSTGYNGSISGQPHCSDVGCLMENDHCVRTVHSEANAIIQAAKNGVRIDGSDLYVTASPCWYCFKLIANAGIKRIVFGELYRDVKITEFAQSAGIQLVHLSKKDKVVVASTYFLNEVHTSHVSKSQAKKERKEYKDGQRIKYSDTSKGKRPRR